VIGWFQAEILPMLLQLVAPVFGVSIVMAASCSELLVWSSGFKRRELTPFLFAFALLGSVPGVIAGSSREPVVGAMLTGLLALLSSTLAFLLSKEGLVKWRPLIPFLMISMLTGALFGLVFGSVYRKQWDGYARAYQDYRSQYDNIYVPVERETRLKALRSVKP
jgi:hypothetical protein